MYEFIMNNFKGITVTIGFTGIPVTVTGEVLSGSDDNTVGLRLSKGNLIFINADFIAFVI